MSVIGLTYILCIILIDAQKVVDTEYGQVRGHRINVNNGIEQTTVDVFFGIPFGKDTSGARRFKRAEAPDPWSGIFEADTIRDMCPQTRALLGMTHPDWDQFGEDCLHLNIFTPTAPPELGSPYPVMVYIHGGAFQSGGNLQYPGHFFASRGIVVAVLNYRLNKFGFTYTGNDASPGNVGMWDQNAGLKFVVNNIANFGGDPNKITVFGLSAGAASTSLNMLSPQSKDLFQQAIMESGAETNDWAFNEPESKPEDYTYQVAEELDCLQPDDYQMMDCLRQKPWRQIVYNASSSCTPGYACAGMAPVMDGPGGFFPMSPTELRRNGSVMSGPIISGISKEDGSVFLPLIFPGVITEDCCNRTYFSYALRERIVGYFEPRLTNVTAEDCYHAFDFNYTPWPHIYDADANRDMLVKLQTDWQFGVPWDRQLKDQQTLATTYGYVFDYKSLNSSLPEWLGTIHAAEKDYVWGYPLLDFNEEVRNDSLFPAEGSTYNAFDVQYSIFIQDLWANFAKNGNPTPSPVNNPLGGTTIWPEFNTDTLDLLYFGNDVIGTISEYRQKDYAFWTNYIKWMTDDDLGKSENRSMDEPFQGLRSMWDPEFLSYMLSDEWMDDDF